MNGRKGRDWIVSAIRSSRRKAQSSYAKASEDILPSLGEAGWCLGPESNQRHADFQSAALPTELPRRSGYGAGPGAERGSIAARSGPVHGAT